MNSNKKKYIICAIVTVLLIAILFIFIQAIKVQRALSTVSPKKPAATQEVQNTDSKSDDPSKDSPVIDEGNLTENDKNNNTNNDINDKNSISEGNRQSETKNDSVSEKSSQTEASSKDLTTAGFQGPLSVNGTQLTDSKGNPVQLKGLSTHGIGWFPQYINADLFKQFKEDFGINVIRLAMYTGEGAGYCTGGNPENLKKLVDDGVNYATENDMYVIIDWHILSDNNPNTYKEKAKKFFEEESSKYKDNEHVLYEICNEPNGGTSWAEVKSYAEEIIPIIRQNAPNAIIIVGTPTWCQDVDKAVSDPLTGYNNIMYALHFYAATHKEALRDRMMSAIQTGLPIFVSEFGICDASGNGNIDQTQSDAWIQTMNDCGVSYIMWNISNKDETSSIFKPSFTGNSHFTNDDLSDCGKWFLDMMKKSNPDAITSAVSGSSKDTSSSFATSDSSKNTSSSVATSDSSKDTSSLVVNSDRSKNSPSDSSTSNSQTVASGNKTPSATISSGSDHVTATLELTNSWEADGHTYEQYNVTITNTGNKELSSWSASVDLKQNFTISQGWCAIFKADGSTLNISPADFNSKLSAGDSTKDIGIIIIK